MKVDFCIHSDRVLLPSGIEDATIFIRNGRIMDVLNGRAEIEGVIIIEAGTLTVMPGLIDSHVHINEPGRTDWEGFDTATKAAAAGGITTLVDMPLNSSPVTTTVSALEEKMKAAQGKLHVNCGFWGGLIPQNADGISNLLNSGVLGIKAFLIDSGINEFPNVSVNDLKKAMPEIAKNNLPLLVHAELKDDSKKIINEIGYNAYLRSRPGKWERDAIKLMFSLCEKYNCKTHIVHLSFAEALEIISQAKKKGLPFTVETCPHYLYFIAEQIPDNNTLFKCAPPIRDYENNKKLWEGLRSGLIDFVVSDHSPSTPDLKLIGTSDWQNAWGGISSLQFSLSAFWTKAKQKGFSLKDVSKRMSEKVAEFINLENRKGKIKKGFDADLVVWDPEKKFEVKQENIYFKNKITPYLGEVLDGVVFQTYVNGKKVYDNGEFVSLAQGQIITRDSV